MGGVGGERFDRVILIVEEAEVVVLSGTAGSAAAASSGKPAIVEIRNWMPGKAALLLGNVASFPMPPISITAADSGQQQFEVATAVAVWRLSDDQSFTRALVLQALDEGLAPHTALFYSSDASVPQERRPHLLLSYVPRAGFGLP